MGVHGLQAYVEAKRGGGSDAPRPVDLGQVAAALPAKDGRATLCVDGSGLLYWLHEYPQSLSYILGGPYEQYPLTPACLPPACAALSWRLFLSRARLLDSVFKLAQRAVQFVEAFRSNGIDLVVYIDGLALPMKRTVMLARRQRTAVRVSTLFDFVQYNKKIENPFKDGILPILSTRTMVHALRSAGASVFFSYFEGDLELAQHAAAHPNCIGVLGKDSDFLIFQMGQNKRYFCLKSLQFRAPKGKSKAKGNRSCKIVAQAFNIEETSRLLGFHHKWLPLFSGIVGNDYTKELIGPLRQAIIGGSFEQSFFTVIEKASLFFARQTVTSSQGETTDGSTTDSQGTDAADDDVERVLCVILDHAVDDAQAFYEGLLRASIDAYTLKQSWGVLPGQGQLPLAYDSGINDVLTERFRRAELFPSLVGVLHDSEFWCSVAVTDHANFRDPYKPRPSSHQPWLLTAPYQLLRPVRRKLYGILLAVEAKKRRQTRAEKLELKKERTRERQATLLGGQAAEGSTQAPGEKTASAGADDVSNKSEATNGKKAARRRRKRSTKTTAVTLTINEIRQTESDYLAKTPVQVVWADQGSSAAMRAAVELPSVAELHSADAPTDLRLCTFLHLFNANWAPFRRSAEVPRQFLVPCCVLRFLLTQGEPPETQPPEAPRAEEATSETGRPGRASNAVDRLPPSYRSCRRNPAFKEWEFDTLLLHVVLRLSKERDVAASNGGRVDLLVAEPREEAAPAWPGGLETNDRKRVLCLGTLYQVGVQHALLGHELCNDPFELPPPYTYFDGREWYDAYIDAWASEKAHEDHLRTQASAFTPQRRARPNRHRRAKLGGGGRSDNRASTSSRAGTNSAVEGAVEVSETDREDYRRKRWTKRYGEEVVRLHARLKEAILDGLIVDEGHSLWRS